MLSAVRSLRSSLNPAELRNGYPTMAFTAMLLPIAILRDVLKPSLVLYGICNSTTVGSPAAWSIVLLTCSFSSNTTPMARINRAQPMDRHMPVSGRHHMVGWKG
eukprot:2706527-Ditylum_brightwellii.AAC.1